MQIVFDLSKDVESSLLKYFTSKYKIKKGGDIIMVCPKCKVNLEIHHIQSGECPFCGYKFEGRIIKEENEKSKANIGQIHSKRLEIMANINIILSVISAVVVLTSYYSEYYGLNIYVIGIVIAILLFGITQYYLLKTIVDIYNK